MGVTISKLDSAFLLLGVLSSISGWEIVGSCLFRWPRWRNFRAGRLVQRPVPQVSCLFRQYILDLYISTVSTVSAYIFIYIYIHSFIISYK